MVNNNNILLPREIKYFGLVCVTRLSSDKLPWEISIYGYVNRTKKLPTIFNMVSSRGVSIPKGKKATHVSSLDTNMKPQRKLFIFTCFIYAIWEWLLFSWQVFSNDECNRQILMQYFILFVELDVGMTFTIYYSWQKFKTASSWTVQWNLRQIFKKFNSVYLL